MAAMSPNIGIICLTTTKFDAMRQFFLDLGLDVKPDDPSMALVTPRFNSGRGTLIILPSLLISLEESTDDQPTGPLHMQIEGVAEDRLVALKGKYSVKHARGAPFGRGFYVIRAPDGSIVHAVAA
jgi:hypothetical protein